MKKLIYFIIIVALIVPSIIAVKSYYDAQNAPANSKNAISVTIDDVNGKSYTLTREENAAELTRLVDYFVGTSAKAVKIAALPDSVSTQKCFRVAISTPVKEVSYQYYLSTNPQLCYLVDPTQGRTYQLAEADAAKFLESKYAESLYEGATRPTLTLSGEHVVNPTDVKWSYKAYGDTFIEADNTSLVSSDKQSFELSGGLGINFDIAPNHCNVKAVDADGFTVFDDEYTDLVNLKIDEVTTVQVTASAKWNKDSTSEYYGEASYTFEATLTPPAAFFVQKTELNPGQFIAISATRVTDPSKITFKSEPEIGFTPTFFTEGDYVHGLFAVPVETKAGDYELTLSYGGTTQKVTLKITDNPRTPANIEIEEAVLASAYTEAAIKEFDDLVAELTKTPSDKRLFDGDFIEAPGGGVLVRGYNRELVINYDPAKSFMNYGVDYMLAAGSDITAQNAGKVVYAGEAAYTGKLVVVDHGLGLMTWYGCLGETKVNVGDTVKKGDAVGTSGTTGLSNGVAGSRIAMSVGGEFVCPYDTWASYDGGVLMEGVLEKDSKK